MTHNLGYAGGNLTAMSVLDGIDYGFTYSQGELVKVTKAGTIVEQHSHTQSETGDTTTTSSYPDSDSPLYSISKVFDKYGRLVSIDSTLSCVYDIAPEFEEDGTLITKANNGSAQLAMTVDSKVSETARYLYTEDGQLKEKAVTSKTNFAAKKNKETFAYDAAGRLIEDELSYQSLTKTITSEIGYAANSATNNSVETYTQKIDGTEAVKTTNTYDNQHRVSRKTVKMGEQTITKNIYYDKTRVSGMSETLPNNNNLQDHCFFDALGRIRTETYSIWQSSSVVSVDVKGYEYDKPGQLVREDNQGLDKTMIYEYNKNGNIIGVKTYDYTTAATPNGTYTSQTFTYDATHKDRLTAFGNKAIAYNANGEMTSLDGWDYTWSKGKLSSISKTLTSSSSTWALKPGLPSLDPIKTKMYSFAYNAFGQRTGMDYSYTSTSTSAISIGEVTDCSKKFYYDHAGRLMLENVTKTYYNDGTASYTIAYLYDESAMIGMEYQTATSSILYYFQRNLQSDVIGIYDADGNLKVRYIYDAWGNCTIASGSDMELAKANPIRYKGYYYDQDTGLYYLNARYYSPQLRRFISPDDTAYLDGETVDGLNLYAYCCNDPVNYKQTSAVLCKAIETIDVIIAMSKNYLKDSCGAKKAKHLRKSRMTRTNGLAEPDVGNYDGECFHFDFSKNPDYGIFTSVYYARKLWEMGLPEGRTALGIWFELLMHYLVHKIDVFDLTDRDDIADMGNYKIDNNAHIWEEIIHGIIGWIKKLCSNKMWV